MHFAAQVHCLQHLVILRPRPRPKGRGGRRGPGRSLEATAPPPPTLIAAESSFSSRRWTRSTPVVDPVPLDMNTLKALKLIVCAVVAVGATLTTLVTMLVLGNILREDAAHS